MPTVERNGVGLYYTDSGSGFPVLLHTGGGGDHQMWQDGGYVDALAGFRLLGFDHRGHGRSGKPADLSSHRIEEYAADVLAVLDHAGVDRCAMVGYSGGAAIGFAVAAAHGDRFSALVALGLVPSEGDADDDEQEVATFLEHVRQIGMRAAMEDMAAEETEHPPAWFLDNLAATPTEMFALAIEASIGLSNWDDLPRITCPTLLICGEHEVHPGDADVAAARCVNGRAVVLPGFGHLQLFWHGEVTAPLVAEFLRSVTRPVDGTTSA